MPTMVAPVIKGTRPTMMAQQAEGNIRKHQTIHSNQQKISNTNPHYLYQNL